MLHVQILKKCFICRSREDRRESGWLWQSNRHLKAHTLRSSLEIGLMSSKTQFLVILRHFQLFNILGSASKCCFKNFREHSIRGSSKSVNALYKKFLNYLFCFLIWILRKSITWPAIFRAII